MRLNKLLSVILAISIILSIFSVINVLPVSGDTVTTAYINGTNVNVRSGPSTGHSIIDKLSNTSAMVLSSVTQQGELWYQITYKKDNQDITGYIFYDPTYIKIVTYNPDADFETKITAFPESYRQYLRELHSVYPNWEFVPDNVHIDFDTAVTAQCEYPKKLVSTSQSLAWRSMHKDYYSWETGQFSSTNAGSGWYGASKEVIAYYMDPRNFLDNTYIYMFLEQAYDQALQTEEGLKDIVEGTFLAGTYEDAEDTAYGGSYVKVIMEAAKQSGVSPYIIASKIIQEQGSAGTSNMISGTTSHGKYYNFMNWGAYGAETDAGVLANGLAYAKNEGWTTRSASIIGGAVKLSNNYIKRGQSTYYYQDFNVKENATHQYAQAVHDAASKGKISGDEYKTNYGYKLYFTIPVFTNMPEKPCERPEQSDKYNNYYIMSITSTDGNISPAFDMFQNDDYSLTLSKDANLNLKIPDTASITSPHEYDLPQGSQKLTITVKAETGYTRDYSLYVFTEAPLKLTLKINEPVDVEPNPNPGTGTEPTPPPTYKLGDVNGDDKISIIDLGIVRLHLLNEYTFNDESLLLAADVNKDDKISIIDLGVLRLYLLGEYSLED